MDRNPFFPNLDGNQPIPVTVILTLGSAVTGLALGVFALLFL